MAWRSPSQSDDDYYSADSSNASDTLPHSRTISLNAREAEASIDAFFLGRRPDFYDLHTGLHRAPLPRADSGLDLSLDADRPSPDLARADMAAMADTALGLIAQLKRLLGEGLQPPSPPPSARLSSAPPRLSASHAHLPTSPLSSIAEEHLYEEVVYEEVAPAPLLPPRPPPPLPLRNPPTTLPKLKPFSRGKGRLSLPLSTSSLPKLLRFRFSSRKKRKLPSKHVFSPELRPAVSEAALHRLHLSPTPARRSGSSVQLNRVSRVWDSPPADPLCGRERLRSLAPRLSAARSAETLRPAALSPFATQV